MESEEQVTILNPDLATTTSQMQQSSQLSSHRGLQKSSKVNRNGSKHSSNLSDAYSRKIEPSPQSTLKAKSGSFASRKSNKSPLKRPKQDALMEPVSKSRPTTAQVKKPAPGKQSTAKLRPQSGKQSAGPLPRSMNATIAYENKTTRKKSPTNSSVLYNKRRDQPPTKQQPAKRSF